VHFAYFVVIKSGVAAVTNYFDFSAPTLRRSMFRGGG